MQREGSNDVNLRRGLAAGAGIFSAVAIGIALESGDPARAVGPPPDGNYTFNQAGVSGVTWTVTALCDQVNGSRYYKDYSNPDIQADFCALNIVELDRRTDQPSGQAAELQRPGPAGRADGGPSRWTWPTAFRARAAAPAPSTETYAFDDETLTGTHTSLHGAVCGLQPAMSKQPFSLQLTGPPPSPIQRYPLQCNDIAMCY